MKELRFEGWVDVLARSQMPEKRKRSWEITLRWYLSFCRRGRTGVTVQSDQAFLRYLGCLL